MKLILFSFSRTEVEQLDFSRFLQSYDLDRLPRGLALKSYFNAFVFCVSGHDDDPRELFEIPEVRKFFGAFNTVWPYWLFGCNLETPQLLVMTLCCLPKLTSVRTQGSTYSRTRFDPQELRQFVLAGFRGMTDLLERSGMSHLENCLRSRQVIQYYLTHGQPNSQPAHKTN